MMVLTVIIPVLMLGAVLALGRYEEWILPPAEEPEQQPHAAVSSPSGV
ncbi:hypothetical protein [Streptomyces jeddahensis]|uniref:Uncharacterized protein n=1 Tax=Streptomyces jeddahensis TaxID=1716141 RepID=A0A177HMD0_9ACTN|nr:hypothetical protein [Streptomyces jeddahensis]OAH12065.1 hypothetical protein STSP_46400 [Streptomyces jeddahensis]